MKKTIKEFYEEIQNSEEMQKELNGFIENKDKKSVVDWAKKHGCETTSEEIKAFLEEKKKEATEDGELTPEDLEQASGGTMVATAVIGVTASQVAMIWFLFDDMCSSSSGC